MSIQFIDNFQEQIQAIGMKFYSILAYVGGTTADQSPLRKWYNALKARKPSKTFVQITSELLKIGIIQKAAYRAFQLAVEYQALIDKSEITPESAGAILKENIRKTFPNLSTSWVELVCALGVAGVKMMLSVKKV